MALLGEVLQFARAGCPLSGLGFGAAGQLHLAEQDVAELLGRSGIDWFAGERLDFVLEPRLFLRKFAGQPRKHLAVDGNAAPFHARKHRRHRALKGLVDRGDAFGGKPRFERVPQAQRDVGVFGRIFAGFLDRYAIERDLRLARAGDVMEMDGVVVEPALGEVVHAVAAFSGVEHIGDEHGVVIAGDLDAALREHQPVILHILRDLEDGLVLEQRLEHGKCIALGNLSLAKLGFGGEQIAFTLATAIAMTDRHVARFVGRKRQ